MNYRQNILLVEDDKVDIKSVKRAFEELSVTNPLVVTLNGEEAIGYLMKNSNNLPALILLDLNMPRMNGLEFLKIIKNEDKFKKIPVVALTTSDENKDKTESFKSGISGYMVKPVDYKDFIEVIRTIKMYWTLSETP